MPALWTPIVFWVLLVPMLIVMLIVYLRSKRFYRLVYILSVFTYAMMIMYWIDSYRLGRNAIVGLLVASSLLMIFIGYRMHNAKPKKAKKNTLNATLSGACLALILIIVGLSAAPIGFQVSSSTVSSIKLSDVAPLLEEGQQSYGSSVPIYTITVTNTFIPRQYELPQASVCLYNAEKKAYANANVFWDTTPLPSDLGLFGNTIEVGRESKTSTLKLSSSPYYRPAPEPAKPIKFEPQIWNEAYLFLSTDTAYYYVDCYNPQQADLAKAIRIPITQD